MLVEPGNDYYKLAKAKRPPDAHRQAWITGGPGAGPDYAGGVESKTEKKTGVTTATDPGIFFGSVFRAVLAKESIPVRGEVLRKRVTDVHGQLRSDVAVLAQTSTKLTDIIGRANKVSRNLFAGCLFKSLGAAPDQYGSWTSGSEAVKTFLIDQVGAKADQFVIDDGSGLSRRNRLSPTVLVAVLKYMHSRDDAEVFRKSLSIWGRDGTLRKRSSKSVLAGRVYAKTGYISGVRSLSGYIRTKRGNWVAFCILMNKVTNGWRARQLQQDICELLVNQ